MLSTLHPFIAVASLLLLLPLYQATILNGRRYISIVIDTGSPIELYWINPDNGEALVVRTQWGGIKVTLPSFAGDVFEIREKPNADADACGSGDDKSCRIVAFTVKDDDIYEQIFRIRSSFELDYDFIEDGDEYKDVDSEDDEDDYNEDYKEHDDNNIEAPRDYQDQDSEEQDFSYIEYVNVSPLRAADTWLPPGPRSRCHEQTKATLERMYSSPIIDSMDASLALMEYTSCVEANLTQELLSTSEELEFQFNALVNAANYFENYTCSDYNLPTSPSIRNETWTYKGINYEVGIMHERPRSMIHVLSNFVTEEECHAIDEAATTGLHAGTLAGEITPERKVMQAYIPVDWEKEAEGDIIAKLSRRLYDYVNHATGLGIREKGQEDIMSIQYAGRGTNETHPDRYVPHCDGDCDGSPYSLGARFATMIMYCTTPLKGGSTNFLNAGIHVVATKGAAIFFSYIGSDDFINDNGFTRHSGCPVIEGEKKIITQFFRVGVDDDHPWDFFET